MKDVDISYYIIIKGDSLLLPIGNKSLDIII